ncbi:MAG: TonB-dependent receptor [Rhodanobacteraceae bacterium]|nr:MAG: TonB-dependent receptor [Rhodanobacteraceae bacterium]
MNDRVLPFVLLLCAPCASMAWTGQAEQQPENATQEPQPPTLETIVVTGSHIRNIDLETRHPVLVLDRAAIERTGLTSISDVVQAIVTNGETLNRNINNGGNGEQLANLRSLGANRTLVLLNGQRFVTDIDGAVDLSAIPLALVDRIEVLLDGASAIYGSDAIAGVINIITRKNVEGGEAGQYSGRTSHDDGARQAYYLTYGHKGDHWGASGGLEYSLDAPIFAGDRAISAVPVYGLPTGTQFTGSPFGPYSFLVPESLLFSGPDFLALRLVNGRPGTTPADFRSIDLASDFYNYQPLNYLQTPQERRAAFAQARYEFTPNLALSADVLFNQRQSRQQLAPSDISVFAFDGTNPDAIAISPDNVYNPFGEPVDIAFRRFVEAGPRLFHQIDDTLRLRVGLDGSFTLLQRDFTWTANVLGTRSDTSEFTGPLADFSKLGPALGPSFLDSAGTAHCGTPNAVIAGCVPMNLFGPPGSITTVMLDYVDAYETNRYRNRSEAANVGLGTDSLFALPAGGLGFAAGAEYRRESGDSILDPLEVSGNAAGNGVSSASTRGAYWLAEAYAEFNAPLLAGTPFARKLDLSLGSRFSHYSNFGNTINSQVGIRWQPTHDLLVRANYAEGFRAPSVNELFQGNVTNQGIDADDPCVVTNNPTAAVLARCAQFGVPPGFNPSIESVGASVQAGNPGLRPETSRSRGVGLVYNPAWLDGFSASVDWYDIRLRDAIGDPGFQGVVDGCYKYGDDADCALITRDPADHNITHLIDEYQNLPGGIETSGYDLTAHYRHGTPWGRFGVGWDASYVDYFGEIGHPAPGSSLPDGAIAHGNTVGLNSASGSLFGVIWRWRTQLQLAWTREPWSASITARSFSAITEDCSTVVNTADFLGQPGLVKLCSGNGATRLVDGLVVPYNRVGSVTFTDLEAGWDAPWHGHLMAGIRNALGRNPPVSYSAFENSFFPDYDIPGRFYYANYRQEF